MGARREGRELALMLLYREAITGLDDAVVPGIEEADPRARSFAESLVRGVREHLGAIDAAISSASEHWDIGRMGAVDKTVLRIGVYEILHERGTPLGVIINEAVEAARKYSSEDCGKFVNGVLDHIAGESRPAERRGGE
jgi:N utilization substance protein B